MTEQAGNVRLCVREICTRQDLDEYRVPWEELLAAAPDAGLFDTYEWLSTWLEFFWQGRAITFLLVHDKDRPVALLPLVSDEVGEIGCKHTLTLPINSYATRADLIGQAVTSEIVETLCDYLQKAHRPVCLRLSSIETTSKLFLSFKQLAHDQKMGIHESFAKICPIVRVDGDWEGYLASRSKHVRQEIRRKRRKLERAGAIRWRSVTSPDDSREAMQDILHIEQRSWKEANQTSFTAVQGLADFYDVLSLRCAQRGWLRNYILYIDDIPVAHMTGMVYRNEYYALKTSYDEHYRELSPGAVLAAYVLEQGFAEKLRVIYFLGIPSRWKNELANGVREHVNCCVYAQNAYRCHMCSFFHSRMKPAIKSCLALVNRGRT